MTKPAGAPKLVEFPAPPSREVRDERIIAHMYPQHTGLPSLVDLVAKSIKKQLRLPPCFELDDLRGAGNIGLIHAAERYCAAFGPSFETYARYRIGDAIRDSIRRRNWRDAVQLSLEEGAVVLKDGVTLLGADITKARAQRSIEETLPDRGELPDQAVQRSQEGHAILGAMQDLPARERAVIHLVYVRGETLDQVSARMGVHRTYVHQLRKKAETRMRQHFARRGRTAA